MDCGSSSILPNGHCSILPITPTDGQIFIDKEMVKWIYNASNDLWERSGTSATIPLVSSTNIGYISYKDKALLDSIPAVPGGFGIITDTKLLLKSESNPEGVISGDIQLKSESLDIACANADGIRLDCSTPPSLECITSTELVPGFTFRLSKKFLDTLVFNLPGPQGKTGHKGAKGPQGKPGYNGGPPGAKGKPGEDIEELCTLTGVVYNDIEGITDTAIVDMDILDDDGHGCKLSVTKAKLNIPGDVPADKLYALPLNRYLVYEPEPDEGTCAISRLTKWKLKKDPGDNTPTNLNLIRLATGSDQNTDQPVGFNANMTLRQFITGIVTAYQKKLTKIDKLYGKHVKEYINNLDNKARTILSNLANELSMCEFDLPAVEYCITFSDNDCLPPSPVGTAAAKASNDSVKVGNRQINALNMGSRRWRVKQ